MLSLLFPRDPNGFNDWTFSTVRCWGERARGVYRLVIRDVGEPSRLTLPCPLESHTAHRKSPLLVGRVAVANKYVLS